ncbi:MAG: DOMON domain-containing protein [Anaerolineae bacterium]
MRQRGWSIFLGMLLIFAVGCSATTTADPTAEPSPTSVAPTEGASDDGGAVPGSIDGVVEAGEYEDEAAFGEMRLWWRHDGEYLYLAMEGPTKGWISVGIEPTRAMKDANFLFGYVEEGEAQFWDAFGTAPVGAAHPPDEELGGTDDVVAFAGVEEAGVTRFEVQIPLASGDKYDKALTPGATYAIIVAMGPTDEYNSKHFFVSSGELTLGE